MSQKLSPVSALADAIVSARDLVRVYGKGDAQVRALDRVDIDLARGEFTAIMGPSGSGKSTLMHCLAGLDAVTSGSILIGGVEIAGLKQREITAIRRDKIGFIFQAFNLIPVMDARQNIELPAMIAGKKLSRKRVEALAAQVGLSERLRHRPTEMSGGQQQRLAVARALANNPQIIFADEPTGNLDSASTLQVLRLLRDTVDKDNHTICMVTHEAGAAAWADRVLFLRDGKIIGQLLKPSEAEIFAAMTEISGKTDEPSAPQAERKTELPPPVWVSLRSSSEREPESTPPVRVSMLPTSVPEPKPTPPVRVSMLPTSVPEPKPTPPVRVSKLPPPMQEPKLPSPPPTKSLFTRDLTPITGLTKVVLSRRERRQRRENRDALATTPLRQQRSRHPSHRADTPSVGITLSDNSAAKSPTFVPPPTDTSPTRHVSGS